MAQFFEFVMNHWMLSLAFVFLLVMLVGGEVQRKMFGMKSIDPQAAIKMMNQNNAVLLDIREPAEHKEGWAANAVKLPMSKLKENPGELESLRGRPLIAYCRSGNSSERACAQLRKLGYDEVYNLAGGLTAWRNANLPVYTS